MRFSNCSRQTRKHIFTCFLLMIVANSYVAAATQTSIEKLFTDALNAQGQAYIDLRQEILNLPIQNDSYLKEKSKSSDFLSNSVSTDNPFSRFVLAIIDKSGKVVKASIAKSLFPQLDEVALKAVEETKFTPGKQRGKPVKVQMTIPITFKLQ